MSPIRDYLLDAYEFADLRRRNRAIDVSIKIDDRDSQDVLSSFCTMTVHVPDSSEDTLILSIQHIPLTAESRSLIEDEGGNIRALPDGYVAEIKLKVKSVTFIRKLARAIRQTIGRGKRYHNSNLKWTCPRTAASLERFATVLKAYNTERKSDQKLRKTSRAVLPTKLCRDQHEHPRERAESPSRDSSNRNTKI